MSNPDLSNYFSNLDAIITKYMNVLSEKYNLTIDDLKSLIKDVKIDNNKVDNNKKNKENNNEKDIKEELKEQRICTFKIKTGKRKNEECGAKVSKLSETGNYCGRHVANEKKEEQQKERQKEKDDIQGNLFKLNKFNNFAYGETGLILKSKEDQFIIGKQDENGDIHDLKEEDIMVCKRNKFKYCANYSQVITNLLE